MPIEQDDKRKQSLYFPEYALKQVQHEALRLDRSLSWIVQQAWVNGGYQFIQKLKGHNE